MKAVVHDIPCLVVGRSGYTGRNERDRLYILGCVVGE